MQVAPRIIGEAKDYQQLITLFRTWIVELGTHGEAIDHVAGLPLRYTMKLLSPRQIKNLGPTSMGPLLGALGLKLVVAVDHGVLERIRSRPPSHEFYLEPRKNANSRMPTQGKPNNKHYSMFKGNSGLARAIKLAGIYRMSKRRRSTIARIAAKARWSRAKLESTAARPRH